MADKEQKDRKAEIERRKKRLEELRLARENKKKEVKDKEVGYNIFLSSTSFNNIFVHRSLINLKA